MKSTPSARQSVSGSYPPEELQLSNGISVILQHVESPVASIYWWVRTGSVDEAPEEAGFAHFLEHMLFKDASAKETGKASTGQLAHLIESLGGDINAYTSFDQTVYHVTCAATHWEKVLNAFGSMAQPQAFLPADFKREREVILEELRKNEDSPSRQLFQSLFSLTFGKHPYGRPVIGFRETLQAARVKQLEKFYKRTYTASRMGIVLVGPLGDRKAKLLRLLERRFGASVIPLAKKGAAKQSTPAAVRGAPPVQTGACWKARPFDVQSPTVLFSFRAPELNHPDLPALDLLTGVLGQGELSRLYRRLFQEKSLVTDVSGGLYVPSDPGMLYFQLELESLEQLEPAVREAFGVLQSILRQGPSAEELARVLASSESERLYATQTVDGLASRLGFLKWILGDLQADQTYLSQLRQTSSQDVQQVAERYLDHRNLNGVVLIPQAGPTPDLSVLERLSRECFTPPAAVSSSLGREAASRKQEPPLKQFEVPLARKRSPIGLPRRFQLSSGLQVCFYPRPHSEVFSVHVSALGGLRLELAYPLRDAQQDWGMSALLAATWPKGTRKRSNTEILGITESCAASLEGFSGRNSVGLQLTGLRRDWSKLSQLLSEVLCEPTFPEEEVEHARRTAVDALKTLEDHSSQFCSKLFLETLYQSHPYGKLTLGSLESLPRIQSEALQAFHRRWVLQPSALSLSISGGVSESALEAWLYDLEHQLLEQQKKAKTPSASLKPQTVASPLSIRLPGEPPLKAPRWIEKSLTREQSHLIVGGLGTVLYSEDKYPLRLLQTVLAGQSGRLFIELREKKSLAYSVAPLNFEGLEPGYVATYIACAPQKKEQALHGIRQVYEDLARKGPSAQEMARAQEYLVGRRAMDLQSDPALAAHFGLEALYGLDLLSQEELAQRIRKVTAKDLRRVCEQYFLEPHQVTSCVG
jgi:zinc protease